MLAGEELITRLARPLGFVSAYSMASMPPQDEPKMCVWSSPSASRTAPTSSTKVSTFHIDSPVRLDFPHPTWS
jgi:hypothetical protein